MRVKSDSEDDDATLQPPPSDIGSVADIDINDDFIIDEESPAVHDQLPSPEEYKAKMKGNGVSRNNFLDGNENGVDIAGTSVDENVHDQLPSVDEYKTSMSIRQGRSSSDTKSRAGLFTFLGLLLVTIIVTSIAVPLALNKQEDKYSGSNTSQITGSSGGSYSGGNSGTSGSSSSSSSGTTPGITSTPYYPPTTSPSLQPVSSKYPPTFSPSLPPVSSGSDSTSDSSRLEKTSKYLVSSGVANQEDLEHADSPQSEAAHWIATEDEFKMNIPSTASANTHTRFIERWTLAVFYFSTGGYTWRYNLKFLESIDHCDWYETFIDTTGSIVRMGVTQCEKLGDDFGEQSEDEMVNRIELSNNALLGSLPVEIQNLRRLQDLILPFNAGLIENSSLTGLIPLSLLKHLELQYCGISGTIPDDFGTLGSLTFLGLGNNFMSGQIPDSFFQLTNLVVLGLDDNIFESPIAPFGKFTNIEKLYIEDKVISGQVTDDIINNGWQKMIDLDISVNRLVGPIPSNIWSMPNLEVLDIHGNDFVGAIPEIESVHNKMMFLSVQDNTLDWRLPETISNLINLAHLDISNNNMVTPFPTSMNQMNNLRSFYTGINPFEEHPIPSFLQSLTNLKELSMKQNKLTGTIPSFIGGLTNLQVLDFDFNQLEGNIPSEIGNLTGIDTLMLNRNFLKGTIPASFASLDDVDILLLDGNNLTGTAEVICKGTTINATFFSADCGEPDPEIECSCCHLCCNDNNAACNNFDWRVNLDGIWEYDFQRVVYSFSQNLLPSDAKADYAKSTTENVKDDTGEVEDDDV